MQINNLAKLGQNITSLTSTNNPEKSNQNQSYSTVESTTKQSIHQYDVHQMSPHELEDLITELRESGQISERESMMLTIERYSILSSGTISNNTKIDMTAYFEERIDVMKSTPGTKGVEYLERSLDILKAVEARNRADIPKSV